MPNTNKFISGLGIRLWRKDGVEFIDGVSGTFNLSLGHSHPAIVEAVIEQVKSLVHLSSSDSQPYVNDLLEALLGLLPQGSAIDAGWFRDLTGSTANECAIKIAQVYTHRSDVISLFLSHHGQTNYTTAASGNSFRRKNLPGTRSDHMIRVPAPYCFRCHYRATYPGCGFVCVEAIKDFIECSSNGEVACLIIEPVMGNGGNIVPPPGYFTALAQLCEEEDILLIADEIQTGLGRTGYALGCEAMDFQPNIITLAKGLGGIGIPVAAVLMEGRLNVLEAHQHSFTSGSNLLGVAAALATIKEINSAAFLAGVRERGKTLGGMLRKLQEEHKCIGDVRGLGYMWGLEIVGPDNEPDPQRTNAIIKAAYDNHRLILRGSRNGFGNVVKVRPALIATEEELNEICWRLGRAISDVE